MTMKNLKVIFPKTLIVFSVLFLFSACKKDKDNSVADNFDPTKYYFTGEAADGMSTSYAWTFKPNAVAYLTAFGGSQDATLTYTYKGGVLEVGGNKFTILDNAITATDNPRYKSYHLQKIPDADAFAGKIFKGTVATNGVNNGKSCLIKFTATGKFTVSIDGFGQTGSGADYTLINNGIATANTGSEGRRHLMSIGGGQLYYSQNNAASKTHYFSILTLQ